VPVSAAQRKGISIYSSDASVREYLHLYLLIHYSAAFVREHLYIPISAASGGEYVRFLKEISVCVPADYCTEYSYSRTV
jgi:hypothetical protein